MSWVCGLPAVVHVASQHCGDASDRRLPINMQVDGFTTFTWHLHLEQSTTNSYRSEEELTASPHCLDLDLNGQKTRRNFWCIPGILGHYTIPKWKEFLKSRKPILRKSYLSTFIHIDKHMDGARDIFWIKSLNGTFLAL